MILSGDIGGTKTKLALYEVKEDGIKLYYQKVFSSRKYSNFLELLEEFKQLAPSFKIKVLTLGIAGPII